MAKVAPTELPPLGSTLSLGRESLHFEDKAVNVEEQGGFITGFGLVNQEVSFMKRHIKCRDCKQFVEKPNQDPALDEEDQLCMCNYPRRQHSKKARENTTHDGSWEYKKHTRTLPTNAFGDIEFVGYGDKVGKYVRVDVDTPMDTMLALLTQAWGMDKPNLLISVTGGAKNFTMKARLKDVFRRGLMKAALTTGAWIITSGTNAGVMKHVGEAVRDFGLTSDGRVVTLGIAPWGCVQNKEILISKDGKGKWPAAYRIENDQSRGQVCLEPNHSHFIFVDNGTQHKFTVEIPFRAKFEEAIGSQKTDTGADAVSVPVCLLVLEGGPGTLQTVHSAINSGTPTVIIKGSGKMADILAFAYQNAREEETVGTDQEGKSVKSTRTELDQHIMSEITEMVKAQFGDTSLSQRMGWIKDCCNKLELLSVFELDSKYSAKDVDLAILKALLKANRSQVMDQLRLALVWNRIDVAKSEIFTDERQWPTGMLDDVMMSAIQLHRVDFVELFLDNGVSLKEFLTIKRLITLYNSIPKSSLLYSLLSKIKEKNRKYFSLADVGHLIQDLLGDFYQPHYLTDDRLRNLDVDRLFGEEDDTARVGRGMNLIQKVTSTAVTGTYVDPSQATDTVDFSRPAQELFIWAVLMNSHKLSKLFWREGRESATAAALFGSSILQSLKKATTDAEMQQRLEANSQDYSELAIGVINTCYSSDDTRTHDLLTHDMPNWGKTSCVLLAVQSDNKQFIQQSACRTLLDRVWKGRMVPDTSFIRIIISTIIFPLIQCGIKFRDDFMTEKAVDDGSSKNKSKDKPNKDNDPVLTRETTKTQPELLRQPTLAFMDTQPMALKSKGYSMLKKHIIFYQAPVVKFILSTITFIIFLFLYAYILLVKLSSDFHFLEGILIGWVFTIALEEVRQFLMGYAYSLKSKITTYFHDAWNILDLITIYLFVQGMALRFVSGDRFLAATRVILCLNFVTFSSRILHIFYISKVLGPKLQMIYGMLKDLMSFVIILFIFLVSYAVASEAILYPNSEISWKLLLSLPRKAYWHLYGELFLDDIEGRNSCSNDPSQYYDIEVLRCPSDVGKYIVPVMMGFYTLMCNILLVNLLIAMFSNTYQKVHASSDKHWCFQRFNLVYEYTQRPVLPPPFILFSHLIMLLTMCFKKCQGESFKSDVFRRVFQNKLLEKELMQWENVIADNYLNSTEKAERNSIAGRMKASMERLEVVMTKVDELHENQGQMAAAVALPGLIPGPDSQTTKLQAGVMKRMETLENQLIHTTKALEWIMTSLQEHNIAAKERKPDMPNLQKKKEEEAREKKAKEEKERQLVKDLLEKKVKSHFKSRVSPYPGAKIYRFSVPDEKVLWEIEYPGYDPPTYTSIEILKMPAYADIDLLAMRCAERQNCIRFNEYDKTCKISRVSFDKSYQVIDGIPLNPRGRTGLRGRGSLGRWGPNHAGDPVVTRWKMLSDGRCEEVDGKPVLEFVAVQRLDNDMWAIPGAICGPGEEPLNVLKTDFAEDTSGSLMDDPNERQKIQTHLEELAKTGKEVYKGYADDPRNTDNAWIETRVVNYHDKDGTILKDQHLRASEDVRAVTWQTVSSTFSLHGSHSYFLKLVAELHDAAF